MYVIESQESEKGRGKAFVNRQDHPRRENWAHVSTARNTLNDWDNKIGRDECVKSRDLTGNIPWWEEKRARKN